MFVLDVGLVLAVYASGVLSRPPDPQPLLAQLAKTLGPWTYLLGGALAFLETGAFVGFLVRGGVHRHPRWRRGRRGRDLSCPAARHRLDQHLLGDTASFFLGRKLGRGFVLRHGARLRRDRSTLAIIAPGPAQ